MKQEGDVMNLREHIEGITPDTSHRKIRELKVCQAMLTDDELEDISSLRAGYALARTRVVQEIIKFDDPWLYEKIKESKSKVPIFNIESLIE